MRGFKGKGALRDNLRTDFRGKTGIVLKDKLSRVLWGVTGRVFKHELGRVFRDGLGRIFGDSLGMELEEVQKSGLKGAFSDKLEKFFMNN